MCVCVAAPKYIYHDCSMDMDDPHKAVRDKAVARAELLDALPVGFVLRGFN